MYPTSLALSKHCNTILTVTSYLKLKLYKIVFIKLIFLRIELRRIENFGQTETEAEGGKKNPETPESKATRNPQELTAEKSVQE